MAQSGETSPLTEIRTPEGINMTQQFMNQTEEYRN